jgi:hypothetical protein
MVPLNLFLKRIANLRVRASREVNPGKKASLEKKIAYVSESIIFFAQKIKFILLKIINFFQIKNTFCKK